MKRTDIIECIQRAFAKVPQPQELTLHVAEAHDSYDYENDKIHRQKDFFGPWQEIPTAHIKACQCALSYLDNVGMCFYLPAYMVWYLQNWGNSREVSSDATLYALDAHLSDRKLAEYQKERFSLFSKEQLHACALFVKFCAEESSGFSDSDFAKKAYQRHWKQHDY